MKRAVDARIEFPLIFSPALCAATSMFFVKVPASLSFPPEEAEVVVVEEVVGAGLVVVVLLSERVNR